MATTIHICGVVEGEQLVLHPLRDEPENFEKILFLVRSSSALNDATIQVRQLGHTFWESPVEVATKVQFDAPLDAGLKPKRLYLASYMMKVAQLVEGDLPYDLVVICNDEVWATKRVAFNHAGSIDLEDYSETATEYFTREVVKDEPQNIVLDADETPINTSEFTDVEVRSFGDGVDDHIATEDLSQHGLDASDYSETAVEYFAKADIEAMKAPADDEEVHYNEDAIEEITDVEVRSFGDGVDDHVATEDLSQHGLDASEYSETAVEYFDPKDVAEMKKRAFVATEEQIDFSKIDLSNIPDITVVTMDDDEEK